ncbi:MAG: M23 family peptidase [Bdellovibrio sp.]|nr:MAG: M23 family peptidase [Bdellovibrio sp.]
MKKKVTLWLMTNELEPTRKWVLSASWVKTLGLMAGIVALIVVAGVVDYVGLLTETIENKRLKAENDQLKRQFQAVEAKVSALENSLERVKTFTTKLKLITNIDSQDRNLNLSMGAQPAPNQQVEEFDQPIGQRPPIQELEKQESEFAAKKPLSETRGELSTQPGKDYQVLAIRIDRSIHDTQMREQSVIDLWELLSERQSLLSSTPNVRPARGWVTSKFGYRISPFTARPAFHAGLDIAASPGSPVFAPADGVVSYSGYDEGYGKLVTIDHGYGVLTRFGHLSQSYVQVGQKVSRWDVIALVGSSGRSTGPHLHYEVRVNGVPRNPTNYILDL